MAHAVNLVKKLKRKEKKKKRENKKRRVQQLSLSACCSAGKCCLERVCVAPIWPPNLCEHTGCRGRVEQEQKDERLSQESLLKFGSREEQ